MVLKIPEKVNVEDFVIDNNIITGVHQTFEKTHSIGEVIFDTLSSKPNHVAQIEAETGKQTTFAEMKDHSIRCGLWLKKQGIGIGDIVVLCTHNHLDMYAPIFATFYTGATYTAWNHIITLRSAQYFMKLFQPKVVFCCESVVDVLIEAAKLENISTEIIVFGTHSNLKSLRDIMQLQSHKEVQAFRPQEIRSPQNTAFIVLSSGSTGLPKGIMHSYENVMKIATALSPYPVSGVALWYSTCYWITGFGFLLQNVLTYGTRIIQAEFDVDDTCRVIEKYKVERLLASPIMMTYLCKSNAFEKYNFQSLKFVFTAGSKVNLKTFEQFKNSLENTIVIQVYGMSETGRCVASQTENSKSIGSVGFAATCNQIKILDLDTGKTLGPNKLGELCLKSPSIMLGYYKNPEATKHAIDEEGWLHSGDKGYYDDNGEFHIVDRIKDLMKYQGHHVSPTEIEEVLLSHPAVMEASVVPIPHDLDTDHPMAFVKKVPGAQVTEEELVNLSSSILGELKKLWGGVKFLDELPKTATGKISRPQLKAMAKTLANNNETKAFIFES